MAGSDPDWALYGNNPVLKSVLSLTEVEQLIDHSHPGGKFEKRKAQFTLRNGYYCGNGEEVIVWIIAVFSPVRICCLTVVNGCISPCGLAVLEH